MPFRTPHNSWEYVLASVSGLFRWFRIHLLLKLRSVTVRIAWTTTKCGNARWTAMDRTLNVITLNEDPLQRRCTTNWATGGTKNLWTPLLNRLVESFLNRDWIYESILWFRSGFDAGIFQSFGSSINQSHLTQIGVIVYIAATTGGKEVHSRGGGEIGPQGPIPIKKKKTPKERPSGSRSQVPSWRAALETCTKFGV